MASHDDHYAHGEMEIADQAATYNSFLVATQWGCVLLAATIGCATLIWGAHVVPLQAIIGCGVFAVVAGLGMRMGGAFTVTAVVFTIIGMLIDGIATLVNMLI